MLQPRQLAGNILIIDRDPARRSATLELLNRRGLHCVEATDVQDAIRRPLQSTPDIVLLSQDLPDGATADAIHAIRNAPTLSTTFIVLQAHRLPEEDVLPDADDCIVLPVPETEYVARLNTLLRLKAHSDARRHSEYQLRTIVEQHADGYLVLNSVGIVVFANAGAGRLFRCEERDLLGQPFEHPPKLGESRDFDIPAQGANAVTLELQASEIQWSGSTMRLVSLRDVTARRRLEQFKAAQTEILERIAAGGALPGILTAAVRLIEGQYPATMCSVLLLSSDGKHLRHGAAIRLPDGYTQAIDGAAIGPTAGSCGTAAFERRNVTVSDIETDPLWENYRHLAREYGLRACWSVPFYATDGKVLGTFAAYAQEPHTPDTAELELLHSCARMVGIAVEHHNVYQALRLSEERVRATFTAAAPGIVSISMEGRVTLANPAYCRIVGYSEQELLSTDIWSTLHPDDVPKVRRAIDELVIDRVERITVEYRCVRADGSTAWVRSGLSLLRTDDLQPDSIVAVTEDITDVKATEQRLRQSEALLEIAGRIARFGGWSIDAKTHLVQWSDQICDTLGYPHDFTLPLADTLEVYTPDSRALLVTALEACFRAGTPLDLELEAQTKTGRRLHARVIGQSVYDSDGQVVRLEGAFHDITDVKQRELQAEREREFLKALLENLFDGIVACDENGALSLFNNATRELHGLPAQPVSPANWSTYYSLFMADGKTPMPTECIPLFRALQGETVRDAELVIAPKGASARFVVCNGQPIIAASGRKLGAVIAMHDITSRHHAERAMRKSEERFRAVARATTDVIWDWNLDRDAIWWNTGIKTLFGFSVDETETTSAFRADRIHPEDKTRVLGGIKRAMQGHADEWVDEYRFMRKDGSFAYVADRAYVLRHENGTAARMIGGMSDISERVRTQQAFMKVAASVSASSGIEFFDQLARTMAEALEADIACVARLQPGTMPARATTVALVMDGASRDNVEFILENTPCAALPDSKECLVIRNVAEHYPDGFASDSQAQTYVGIRLIDSAHQPIGLLFALFRRDLPNSDYNASALRIFAARASAELERQDADERIRHQASLLDQAQDAIFVHDMEQRIVFWNKGAERLYGWSADEATDSLAPDLLYDFPEEFSDGIRQVLAHGEWTGEIQQRRKDGSLFMVEGHWTLVRDQHEAPQSILVINTDITQRKAAEGEIQRLAFFDPLTRLPNRQLLLDRLQHALALSQRNQRTGVVLFIDLDNFKTLNDTLGHDIGDLLLQMAAQRLTDCVSERDTVARLGGDEFVVMLEDLATDTGESVAQAKQVSDAILATLNNPYRLAEHQYHSTASIGITLFEKHDDTVGEILKRADLAMYQAKAAGRNTARFFDPAMQALLASRAQLEADLRKALRRGEFRLYYQPQVDRKNRVINVEALIRWEHPQRGLISPAEFIPLSEETGLILPLGLWVVETACRQLVTWAAHPSTADLSVAVNVSARQFRHADFVEQVLDTLASTGARPERLKLELTESLLLDDVEDTVYKMTALKAHGVGFSLDDFGTGYSSLSYLKRLPLDQLKIDQSFVRDVLIDPNDAVIARSILALGHNLGLDVVAEGVETDRQRDFLAYYGCNAFQGYLFTPPLPAEQFDRYMRDRTGDAATTLAGL